MWAETLAATVGSISFLALTQEGKITGSYPFHLTGLRGGRKLENRVVPVLLEKTQ